MDLDVLYFAWCKEQIGCAQESVTVPAGIETLSEFMNWMAGRGEGYASVFSDASRVRSAVNFEHVQADRHLKSGDEIAFFPPVTGG